MSRDIKRNSKQTRKSAPIFYFDRNGVMQLVLSDDSIPYTKGEADEELNGAVTINIEVLATNPDIEKIENEGRLITRDSDDNLKEFIIRNIEDSDDGKNPVKIIEGEGSEYDLIDDFLSGYTQSSVYIQDALESILQGTGWQIGHVDIFKQQRPLDLKNISVRKAIIQIANAFDGDVKYRIETKGNRITGRYVDVYKNRGSKRVSHRFEDGVDIESSSRELDSTPIKTALYAKGKSDGNGNRLTIADIEWSKDNGDPIDKPKGELYIGDPKALKLWGRPTSAGKKHKFGFYDGQEEDSGELALNAYNELQKKINLNKTYDTTVLNLGKMLGISYYDVHLGDTVEVVNRSVYPNIVSDATVIEYIHNLNDKRQSKIKLGHYRNSLNLANRVNDVEKDYNENKGDFEKKPDIVKNEITDKIEDAMQDVNSELDRIEDEVIPNVEEAVKETTIPRQDTPPEKVPESGLWLDTSEQPPLLKMWDEVNEEWVVVASNKDEIDKAMKDAREEAERKAKEYTDKEINQAQKNIDNKLDDQIDNVNKDINDLEDTSKNLKDRANNIESDVADKAGLEYVDGELKDKVNHSDYDSEVNKLTSDIADKAGLKYVDGKFKDKADNSTVNNLKDTADSLKDDVSKHSDELDKHDGQITSIETNVDDVEGQLKTTVSSLKDAESNIQRNTSSIEQNADSIETKVSESTYNDDINDKNNGLKEKVSNAESSIEQNANNIESKVSQSTYDSDINDEYDGLKEKVSQAESNIKQNADSIESKVSQTEYTKDQDDIVDRINSAKSDITQNADSISSKVEQSTYQSDMENKQDNIPKQKFVPEKPEENDLWWDTSSNPNVLKRYDGKEWQKTTPTKADEVGAFSDSEGEDVKGRIDSTESQINQQADEIEQRVTKETYDKDINDEYDGLKERVSSAESSITQHADEIESKVSQNDYDKDINNNKDGLKKKVSKAESQISQNAYNIQSKVEQTEYDKDQDDVVNRLDKAESSITQNADSISSKVGKTEYESGIKDAKQHTNEELQNYVDKTVYNQDLKELANKIDGVIETHFFEHDPTMDNKPTVDWSTKDYEDHTGDLFYNTKNGLVFRFAKKDNQYQWLSVENTAIQKALKQASEAQATADNKRRTFVDKPFTPYDEGDIWVQDDNILVSTKHRDSSFVKDDWIKKADITSENTANDVKNVNGEKAENVVNRIKETESSIDQQADEIKSKVSQTKYDKDINDEKYGLKKKISDAESSITQNADSIESKVEKTYVDTEVDEVNKEVSIIKQGAQEIGSTVSKMKQVQGEFDDRISGFSSDITQNAEGIKLQASEIKNKVDKNRYEAQMTKFDVGVAKINSHVEDNEKKVDGNTDEIESTKSQVSNVEQKANKIESTVTSVETSVDGLEKEMTSVQTDIKQMPDEIELSVKEGLREEFPEKDSIVTSINLNKQGATIEGNKIDLDGLVSVLNEDGSTGTQIDGDKIRTGTVKASQVDADNLFANSAVIDHIQSKAVQTATLDATKITSGSLDAGKISVVNLSASSIITGTLDAKKVTVKNISAMDLEVGKNVKMGYGATISWYNINGKPSIPSKASDVGARPDDWTPSAYDVGARSKYWTPTASQVGALSDTYKGRLTHITSNGIYTGSVSAQNIVGQTISGVNLETDKTNYKHIHMKDQEISLYDHGSEKLLIGFRNDDGRTVNEPYMIWGEGNIYGKSKMVMEKGEQHFYQRYSARNGTSELVFKYSGATWLKGDNFLTFKVGGSSKIAQLNANGNFKVESAYKDTSTRSGQQVRVTHNGYLQRVTSSREQKLYEKPVDVDYASRLLDIDAKTWFDKEISENLAKEMETGESIEETEGERVERIGGVIAEDLDEAGLETYVSYDENGKPNGIESNAWTLLIPLMKDSRNTINQLQEENDQLKDRIKKLEK